MLIINLIAEYIRLLFAFRDDNLVDDINTGLYPWTDNTNTALKEIKQRTDNSFTIRYDKREGGWFYTFEIDNTVRTNFVACATPAQVVQSAYLDCFGLKKSQELFGFDSTKKQIRHIT